MDYAKEIAKLKKEKNAVILAHYYTIGEVQEVADFIGDSLALSQEAAQTGADIIVFAGVNFMGETAKILSPGKKVLMPDPMAGCSLAESCPIDRFERFKAEHPGHKVVSYVNTTVGIKALTDICCTSSNAMKVVESIPADQPIIFAPDRNLGAYIRNKTGRDNMVLWDGACHVHEKFTADKILKLKEEYPGAKIAAHPECRDSILAIADFIGSTSSIIAFCGNDPGRDYIVVTEPGIIHEMKKEYPSKRFIPVAPYNEDCGCNECQFMKMVTLEKIYKCLVDESPEVIIDEKIRLEALGSIEKMLELSN